MLSYRVMLDVPAQLALFAARLLAAHCREIGTRRGTRALTAWQQAVFARYLDEAIMVLATRAPAVREAVERPGEEELPYLILDSKVVDADQCKEKIISRKGIEIDRWYSGKAHGFVFLSDDEGRSSDAGQLGKVSDRPRTDHLMDSLDYQGIGNQSPRGKLRQQTAVFASIQAKARRP
jgi:hypothetical protein